MSLPSQSDTAYLMCDGCTWVLPIMHTDENGRCPQCEGRLIVVDDHEAREVEVQRLREALHTICGLTHQDIDEEPFWRLVSRIHHVARAAVDPPAKETR